jgi:hypothetical protein
LNTYAEPGEEEHSAILVEWIEDWDGASFPVDWVHLGCPPEEADIETHCIERIGARTMDTY